MMLIVSPAYGRDYTTPEEALEAWKEGKDFRQHNYPGGGTYTSSRDDHRSFGIDSVMIVFNRKTECAFVGARELWLSHPCDLHYRTELVELGVRVTDALEQEIQERDLTEDRS